MELAALCSAIAAAKTSHLVPLLKAERDVASSELIEEKYGKTTHDAVEEEAEVHSSLNVIATVAVGLVCVVTTVVYTMTTLVAQRGVGGVDNRRTNFEEAEKNEVYKAAPVSTFLQTRVLEDF